MTAGTPISEYLNPDATASQVINVSASAGGTSALSPVLAETGHVVANAAGGSFQNAASQSAQIGNDGLTVDRDLQKVLGIKALQA